MTYICGLYTIDMGNYKQSRVIRAYRVLDTGTMEMKYYRDLSVVSCVTGIACSTLRNWYGKNGGCYSRGCWRVDRIEVICGYVGDKGGSVDFMRRIRNK